MKTSLKLLVIAAFVGITFYACKKTADPITDSDIATATDNTVAQKGTQDAGATAQEALSGSLSGRYMKDTSVTITIDTTATPHTMSITYKGIPNLKGILRKGKMLVNFDKHYRIPGSVWNITFVDYAYNNNQINGTIKITNNNGVYEISSTNLNVALENKSLIAFTSFNVGLTYYDEGGNPTPISESKNSLYVWGLIKGTDTPPGKPTVTYKDSIPKTEFLIYNQSCMDGTKPKPHFTKGTVYYSEGTKEAVINFGTGNCADKAKIKSGGIEKDFVY